MRPTGLALATRGRLPAGGLAWSVRGRLRGRTAAVLRQPAMRLRVRASGYDLRPAVGGYRLAGVAGGYELRRVDE